jgi:hypothetical protein
MRQAFDVVMRIVSTLLGLLMIVLGCIWVMQGLSVGPSAIMEGFMVGDLRWAIYGAILAVFGVGQVIWSNSRRSSGGGST